MSQSANAAVEETMPADCIIEGSPDAAGHQPSFRPWSGEDLASGAWDVSVVVWQWCRGVPERHGNLMALSDEWWCPYLPGENAAVERAFADNRETTEIQVRDRTLVIKFTPGASFALQRDEAVDDDDSWRRDADDAPGAAGAAVARLEVHDVRTRRGIVCVERVALHVQPLVRAAALCGESATVFARGEVGAGKTWTIFGGEHTESRDATEENVGLLPRAVDELFQLRDAQRKQGRGE